LNAWIWAQLFKVSQAVSGEIVLERLVDTLMRSAIEHAGAERGLLILNRGASQQAEAEAPTSGGTIIVRSGSAAVAKAAFSGSIVQYVLRTHESVILADASAQNPFSGDTYVQRHQARSILCLPLINQGKITGALYLENHLASDVFTPARITVLKLLASQAATSLENTRLYRELQEREEALRRSQAYLGQAQRLSQTGSLWWKVSTGELIWSDEAFRILGYDQTARPSVDLVFQRVHPEDLRLVQETFSRSAREGTGMDFEHRFLMPNGSVKHVHAVLEPINLDPDHREFVGTVMDITERKQAQEAVSKAQAELAHATRVMTVGELTASISHEINQPLAGMVTNANASLRWLAGETPNLAEARDAIRRIVRDGNRASDVIARVRALFKKTPAAKEPVDINEIIQEVLAVTQNELQRNRVSLRTEFAKDLPMVIGDKIQLQRVILNLVVNAVEAMRGVSDGSKELYLSSENVTDSLGGAGIDAIKGKPLTESESGSVLVAVRDSGPGLKPTQLDQVFETYYTTKPQGMGMGLAISRSIIEAHRGHLWATANASRGAIFQFILPWSRTYIDAQPFHLSEFNVAAGATVP
jgi:PAS domain S-box-containing protein